MAQLRTNQSANATTDGMPGVPAEPAAPAWSFSASAYAYFTRDSQDYVQPTVRADRRWLHLEARYNYEALNTASAWVGYNFSTGDKLMLNFTPIVGGVFGKTTGIAPGYELTLTWRRVQLYSEGEYVLDAGEASNSSFYTWSELTLAPTSWFHFGLVLQRTKVYQTDLDVQRGLLVRFSYKKVDLSAYVFNPDTDQATYVVSINVSF